MNLGIIKSVQGCVHTSPTHTCIIYLEFDEHLKSEF